MAIAVPGADTIELKRDALGRVCTTSGPGGAVVVRDTRHAARSVRWLARRLAAREAAALAHLAAVPGVPRLIDFDGHALTRTLLPGEPMHRSRPRSAAYFRAALRVLRRMHACGVAHNDLAKEANWLVGPAGEAYIVDFQIALRARRRGLLFRLLAHEDLRHWVKHKRTYLPDRLTARQRALLSRPSILTRAWRAAVKPLYLFVTRRILGWPERTGPEERKH